MIGVRVRILNAPTDSEIGRFLVTHKEHFLIAVLVIVAGRAHATNMMHFPYVEDDEGTYVSQAWAILNEHQLAAYTYWYDHAPLGWMQIAAWFLLTGGTHFMGNGIASGRVLMLLVQCVSVLLVFGIVRSITGEIWPAVLAVLCFSLLWIVIRHWFLDEPLLVGGGTVAALLCASTFWLNRTVSVLGLCTLALWAFMAPPTANRRMSRGTRTATSIAIGRTKKAVSSFERTPLLGPLAINLALIVWLAVRCTGGRSGTTIVRTRRGAIVILAFAGCWFVLATAYLQTDLGLGSDHMALWNGRQADAQQEAADWVQKNFSPPSRIVLDQSMWMAMHDPSRGEQVYSSAHYYWKVEADPDISHRVFEDNWRNVDYVITTTQLLTDARIEHLQLVESALQHSTVLIRFDTGGWPIEVRKVDAGLRASRLDARVGPVGTSAEGSGPALCGEPAG